MQMSICKSYLESGSTTSIASVRASGILFETVITEAIANLAKLLVSLGAHRAPFCVGDPR